MWRSVSAKVFALAFLVLTTSSSCLADGGAIFYSSRPDVLELDVTHYAEPGSVTNWPKVQEAYFVLLAQILTSFPDGEFYFLARDIEYLYDLARIIFKDDPVQLQRLHLIPVSRNIARDGNLHLYLAQEGLTGERLENRRPVFIDSCCSGTIPVALMDVLRPLGISPKAFLVQTDYFPNSTLFNGYGVSGKAIENHPHFHGTAVGIKKTDGGMYEVIVQEMGEDAAAEAVKMMASLKRRYDNDRARERFARLLQRMRTVFVYLTRSSEVSEDNALRAFVELQVRDGIHGETLIEDMYSMERHAYASVDRDRGGLILKARIRDESAADFMRAYRYLSREDFAAMEPVLAWGIGARMFQKLAFVTNGGLEIYGQEFTDTVKRWTGIYGSELALPHLTAHLVRNMFLASNRAKLLANELPIIGGMSISKALGSTEHGKKVKDGLLMAMKTDAYSSWVPGSLTNIMISKLIEQDTDRNVLGSLIDALIEKVHLGQLDGFVHFLLERGSKVGSPAQLARWAWSAVKRQQPISMSLMQSILDSSDLMGCDERVCLSFQRWLIAENVAFQDGVAGGVQSLSLNAMGEHRLLVEHTYGKKEDAKDIRTIGDLVAKVKTSPGARRSRECVDALRRFPEAS